MNGFERDKGLLENSNDRYWFEIGYKQAVSLLRSEDCEREETQDTMPASMWADWLEFKFKDI